MLRYILKRLLQGVFVLIGVSIVIFCLSRIIPGDPARLALGQHATQEAVDNLSKQMYLDKPLPVQYILWFRDVLHGDFGISLSTRRSVTEDMKQLLPATFELIFWSALFMVGGSLILGRAAARHRDGILDSIIRVFSYIGIAVPSFVVAIVLLVIFGNLWQVIPTLGRLSTGVAPPDTITGFYVLDALVQGQFSTAWDAFLHLLLPAFALSLGGMFQDARLMRSALTDNMGKEYMCVSRSYGLPEKVLMNRYLFKPSSTSVITVMGMDIASMVGNAFMVEQVFNWPGFSKYGANAMITKDLNSVCAVVLVIGATFLVVNLIPRFYDVSEGEVDIAGKNIQDYTYGSLRNTISVVPQKAQLFAGTIRDNLTFGCPDATEEQIEEALAISQAKEFVDTKEGRLDAKIEQGGKNLSGGQRQRLTLARALVPQSDILIMDDSASALDYATDARLRKAIQDMKRKPTVFIVSQRTSSIQNADMILVLDDGKIAGQGTHEQLLKSCNIYREIYETQFKKEEA